MKVRFLTEADTEFREAARYYETKVLGLGFKFIVETKRVILLLAENPQIGKTIPENLRKVPLRRFPYDLIFSLEPDEILIVAVAHHKRRPYYWRKRLRNN